MCGFITSQCAGCFFFFSSRRRHTRLQGDWSSDVCSSDLLLAQGVMGGEQGLNAADARADQDAEAVAVHLRGRSEERRVGKSVDLGGRRIIKKKKKRENRKQYI